MDKVAELAGKIITEADKQPVNAGSINSTLIIVVVIIAGAAVIAFGYYLIYRIALKLCRR